MIIYRILNKINNKSYIGQTTNSFKKRYWGKGWHENTHNKYLKKSVKKYGLVNFEVHFLEENIESIDKLNQLEVFYISKYNTMFPNGYNFKTGGENGNHSEITKKKIKESGISTRNKKWSFKNHKTGELISTNNLSEFCRTYNLSLPNMISLSGGLNNKKSGKKYRKRVGYWTLPDIKLKSWKIKSPEGEVFIILEGELNKFCRDRKMHKNGFLTMFLVNENKTNQYKGWTKV